MKIDDSIPQQYQNNEAYMNLLGRVSVRRYTDAPVTGEQLTAILHAAMSAPSAVNRQPWEFIIVERPALLAKLAAVLPYTKMAAHAPLAIVVCANKDRMLEGQDDALWEQDLSAASENILLAAHAIGLGGVWTCLYPHPERMEPVRAILHIPDAFIPFNLIPIGKPLENRPAMNKWHPERIHRPEEE